MADPPPPPSIASPSVPAGRTGRAAALRQLYGFFWPLAVTAALMNVSHSLISAGLARTTMPALALAGYALALSLSTITEAPLFSVRQMTVALVANRATYRAVTWVLYSTLAISTSVAIVLAYTPVGPWVFTNVFGADPDLVAESRRAFQIVIFMPIFTSLRSLYQGLLIRSRRTLVLSMAMVLRLGLMAAIIYTAVNWAWIDGSRLGAVALIMGVLIESVFSGVRTRRERRALLTDEPGHDEATIHRPSASSPGPMMFTAETIRRRRWWARLLPDRAVPEVSQALSFFMPLMIAALVLSVSKPLINAGLARAEDGAFALAGWAVANAVAWIVVQPCMNIHQVTMVYARQEDVRRHLPLFVNVTSIVATVILLTLAWSPAGVWLFSQLIGVGDELLGHTLAALKVISLFPLIKGRLEYDTGLLLLTQQTRLISLAKILNVALIGVAIMVLTMLGTISSATAPAIQLAGFTLEWLVLRVGSMSVDHRLRLWYVVGWLRRTRLPRFLRPWSLTHWVRSRRR
ncbi:MAG: hypothetical protein WD535_00645 [Thermaerobacterales bacterium]